MSFSRSKVGYSELRRSGAIHAGEQRVPEQGSVVDWHVIGQTGDRERKLPGVQARALLPLP